MTNGCTHRAAVTEIMIYIVEAGANGDIQKKPFLEPG
jgi:hypothetical protein